MKSRWVVLLTLFAVLAGLAAPSLAFDGHRRGFFLGGGLGPGYTSWSHDYPDSLVVPSDSGFTAITHRSGNNAALATDLRIGFGFSNRWLVFYDKRINWIFSGTDATVADITTTVATSYYFKEVHPAAYLIGGAGLSAWETHYRYASGSPRWLGSGYFGGAGYEMNRWLSAEGTVSYGRPSGTISGFVLSSRVKTSSVSLRAHLLMHWY